MKANQNFIKINTVKEYHVLLQMDKPKHPLVSIMDFSKDRYCMPDVASTIVLNLYCISIKQDAECILRYGPMHYDFSEGVMSFIKPGQVISVDSQVDNVKEGYLVIFHPDLIRAFNLGQKIKKYAFFNYDANEALFLSDDEKQHILTIMSGIEREYFTTIDSFSQEATVAFIELLMVYAERYFTRQFITRKTYSDPLLATFEHLLEDYFSSGKPLQLGLPNVKYFADKLNMSPNYLSDMLRITTGQSVQNHIQDKITEEAKTLLATSGSSVAEIAYLLGFEQPQSLNRLFKRKTQMSPIAYRHSFN